MRLIELLTVEERDVDVLDAHLDFHLAAGVDLVLAAADPGGEAAAILERYGDERVRRVERGRLEQVGDADWVLAPEPHEFWWPRGESLKDPLAAMPARYGIIQGLVRTFVPMPGDAPFAERMTMRVASPEPLDRALRPLVRSGKDEGIPLRAWYPFEVLSFPDRAPEKDAQDDRDLVADTRLRDALATLRQTGTLTFRVPDLVEDAAYAVDCAAVKEVDLPRLEREVGELEARVAWLEQRLWPRVLRRLARLGGR